MEDELLVLKVKWALCSPKQSKGVKLERTEKKSCLVTVLKLAIIEL